MKRAFSLKTHIPLLSLTAMTLSSCSHEELPGRVATTDDSTITFLTSLPGIEASLYSIVCRAAADSGE